MQVAAAHNVIYVDLYREAKDDLFLTDIKKYYAPDLLHLTEAGYGNWYEQIRSSMTRSKITLK